MSIAYPPTVYPPMPAPWPLPPEPALPTTPVRYHGLWRSPRWRVWRPIVGALVAGALWFAAALVLSMLAIATTIARQGIAVQDYLEQILTGGGFTPELFITNNLALACSIPIAWLVARIHSQPIRFVHSVTGRFRWRWFGGCLLMFLPLWGVFITLSVVLSDEGMGELSVNENTVVLLLGVLLTTPIQCAGEEWFFRGGINRLVASCFPQHTRTLGLVSAVTGCVVSSFFFMLAHGAQDPWLNIFYFGFGVAACLMCYRTGGLEASTAMHIVNNMTAMITLPFSDISHMMDRTDGAGSPLSLLQLGFVALAVLLVYWRARARRLAVTCEPAAQPMVAGHWPQGVQVPLPTISQGGMPYQLSAGQPVPQWAGQPVPQWAGQPVPQWAGQPVPQQGLPQQWAGQLSGAADRTARPPAEADVPTTTTARSRPAMNPPGTGTDGPVGVLDELLDGPNPPGTGAHAEWTSPAGDRPAPAPQQPWGPPPAGAQDTRAQATMAPPPTEPSDAELLSWGPPVDPSRIMEGEPPSSERTAP
ncbi:CPBP family intramembrane glutamic endopeptidase [Propionibacterium australiense]|uniref:CPBP family intramembrane glutamic endopeptidase n=1 Tax=Propionibacterium australiense TaxID=119981 RepID=UPI000F6E11F2|nr:CPBP family intramembrane glutamic endopeptidase [Propionibacterium australiense]VEH90994.1 CAAX amino terminal protease self- immunity [Propionibacterium australiense]